MIVDSWIIDGYVDEPACLGVPPYISPYIRSVAGVLLENGYSPGYRTIDQIRKDPIQIKDIGNADLVVMIAGVTVPGKYLGGTPATWQEIRQIGSSLTHTNTLLGGPILFGIGNQGGHVSEKMESFGFSSHLSGSPAGALSRWLAGKEPVSRFLYNDEDPWMVKGAGIIRQHPLYPNILCEIETARGCHREVSGGCSFCTEPFYGKPVCRSQSGITDEIKALSSAGAVHFRLGRQPDILTWQAGQGEFPKPRPDILEGLFSGIRNVAQDLKTLHIDNVNPGTIARHPDLAREALSVIVKYHTPGDVAALGMETADPVVIEENNLKASPDMVLEAIRIVNETGAVRKNEIPELLPGLNFISGLSGETSDTYEKNRLFLKKILSLGYLVRRVNIRQLMPVFGTRAYSSNTIPVDQKEFQGFKEWTRKIFDLPMIKKVFPVWTVLRSVVIEESEDLSFGRQLGSYPVLVGIPLLIPEKTLIDVIIVNHGMRSVTALPFPIQVNNLPHKALKWIPGLSKKGLINILAKRPFITIKEFEEASGLKNISQVISLTDH